MTATHDTIASRVEALQAGMADAMPADASSAFAAEQAALRERGVPTGVAAAGTPFPAVELLDPTGAPTDVSTVAAGRPAVVVLYRGAWCPYCNVALRTYQEQLLPELDRRGVALIAISPQKADGSLTMREKNELTFAVLSDQGNRIASALGVLTEPSAEAREVQTGLGLDLTAVNADGTAGLPMPTVVVTAADGTITWIDVHPDYTSRTEPSDILRALDARAG